MTLFLPHRAGYRLILALTLIREGFLPTRCGIPKTDLSLSKNSETFMGGNCIVSRAMRAMVKQSDNRSCFHAESRPITFRVLCAKKQGRHFLTNDNLYRVTTLFLPHTARDAENRLVTSFLPLAFQFSRRGAEWDKEELLLFKE